MALPGHRRTSSDRKRRAAHFALKKKDLAACSKCKQPILAHRACANCGTYKGRVAIDTSRQANRNLSKARAKIAATKPVEEKKEKVETEETTKDSKKDASEK